MDEISLQIYEALAYHVSQANMNQRLKTVSVWSLQMTATAVLSALRNAIDPLAMQQNWQRHMYLPDNLAIADVEAAFGNRDEDLDPLQVEQSMRLV